MRIVIVAVGTTGDVLPYTGLGARLQAAGHEVAIASHAPFESTVRACGLEFHPLPMDLRAELQSAQGQDALRASAAGTAGNLRIYARHLPAMGLAIEAAAQKADLLMLSTMAWLGIHVAEGLGVPSMGVYLQPLDPAAEIPPWPLTSRSLGPWGNRAAASALRVLGLLPFRRVISDLRARHGLAPIGPARLFARLDQQRWPIFYGVSPTVLPQPRDWPAHRRVVGYWWPQPLPDQAPPADLVDFLSAGPAPVVVGLGSMPPRQAEQVLDAFRSALHRAKLRAVVQSGWAGLDAAADDDLFTVGEVAHDWLFPQAAAVVHHAGAGTTAAGLRAGVPAVPLPLAADQPFWASRLVMLGVAPAALPLRRIDSPALAAALTAVTSDPAYRTRARAVAARIADEDGAGAVVRAVEEL
jgi:sterol 3beta-glucosyltransferase